MRRQHVVRILGFAFVLFAQLYAMRLWAAPASPTISVEYPGAGSTLPYVRRSFVFGSATPGSKVSVNGTAALVAATGGWIAYVPFAPGDFHLQATATLGGVTTSYNWSVRVAQPPRTLAAIPARVDQTQPPEPANDTDLNPGDPLQLFVKASTGARVTASLGDVGTISLSEKHVASLNPSDKERILGDAAMGGEDVGGLYVGEMRIPASASGALHVTYTVTATDGSQTKTTAGGTVTVLPAGWYRVGTIVLADRKKDIDARPFGIVESDPDGGWLFFPPEHTPFEVTGRIGDYQRVALGASERGWIKRTSLSLLPEGTPKPHTSVEGVVVSNTAKTSTVVIHLTERSPFWVSESTEPPSLRVRLFNAFAATEFVRYGSDRSNVAEIRWDQPQGGVVTIDIKLRQRTLWGYRAQWQGNDLKLTIKKPPPFAAAPAAAVRGLLVVIDPGHSPDSGSVGPLGTQERDVNLSIAKRLAVHLARLGARTLLTRTSDTPVGLYDRTDIAIRANADILVSVHNNALPDGVDPFTHHGFSVYYYQPQSLGLARAIHDAYRRDTSLPDYGLYYDNLALVRPTEEPAVLTESAFIMWPPEEEQLRDPAFQDRLGATIADGINHWAASMRTREGHS